MYLTTDEKNNIESLKAGESTIVEGSCKYRSMKHKIARYSDKLYRVTEYKNDTYMSHTHVTDASEAIITIERSRFVSDAFM